MSGPLTFRASEQLQPGVKLLLRAAETARSMGDLPERHDAYIGVLGMIITRILKSSPQDQAELVELLGKVMRR